jgi:hypothetical protein
MRPNNVWAHLFTTSIREHSPESREIPTNLLQTLISTPRKAAAFLDSNKYIVVN